MADILSAVLGPAQGDDLYTEIIKENLDNRILVFNQEVDDDAVENYILRILKWNRDDIDIPVEKRKKIKIYINSVGGDTFVASNMVDVIMQSKTPIMVVGLSLVASAAFHIFLAGHERISFSHTIFLQHDGSISISNSSKKARETMDFLSESEQVTKEFVLARTKMTEEFYDDHYDVELYLLATKAKELGIVDYIIGEDISIEEIL